MISKIIGWWKGQPVIVKILLGIFVGLLIVVIFVGSYLLSSRGGESSVLDTAVDFHEEQTKRRQEELHRRDEEGMAAVERADTNLGRLKEEGQVAEDRRVARDEEIRNADTWGDLDNELGPARDRGRTGVR